MKKKVFYLILIPVLIGILSLKIGLSAHQGISLAVFSMSILGTIFFWEFRLSFVFLGTGILLLTRTVDLENVLKFASLDIIIFLIGMMILVGMLKEAGFFYWFITKLLRIKKLTGQKLFLLLMVISAVLSGLMDEVTSTIIMIKVIFEICDFFEIDPVPLIISSILATNVGSSGTVLGNPIGVLIATQGGLTFEDFLTHALPVTFFVLLITLLLLVLWYRNYIRELNKKFSVLEGNEFFISLISVPSDKKTKTGIIIFTLAIISIALHHRLELLFNLEENTLLLMAPIIFAGIVMIYRYDKARFYVEHDVEWVSLLFFMFLFAEAGTIKYTGVADFFAKHIVARLGNLPVLLNGIILFSSGVLSSVLDNVVVVASYIPLLKSLNLPYLISRYLWWALLFGACYGGNITMIGSTANIVALGILEREKNIKINFFEWLKIGLIIGTVSMLFAFVGIVGYYFMAY